MTHTLQRPTATSAGRLRGQARIAGLDGLRAVAVIAVMLYHAGVKWIPGGLLGVDVFFVISGFLITSLLISERTRNGRIALGRFWGRRLRRLMPALVLVIVFVSVTWGLLLKEDVLSLRRDVLFALGYSANWWFAFSGKGYFQSLAAPSPVLHTWSLAVEEQFYLVWPLVVAALLSRGRRVAVWAAGGAAVAALSTLIQSLAGVWTDRLYYGSDTRAVPLLVGAAAGAWYVNRGERAPLTPSQSRALQLAGLAAAVGLGWAFATVGGQSTGLYRGGFLALAVVVSVLIVSIALTPRGLLGRLLSLRGLRYLGAISYGLYLWHWPLFLLVNHQRTGLVGANLLSLRLALTLTVAAVSYEFIEQPIREGRWTLPRPKIMVPVAVMTLVATVVAATPPQSSAPQLISKAPALASPLPAASAQPIPTPSPGANVGTVRILIAGDSLALTLAASLERSEKDYQIAIDNYGVLGCGITDDTRRLQDQLNRPPDYCATLPQRRAERVVAERPDLVALLVGRWEVTDQLHNGQWEYVGEPDFDAYLSSQLDKAIEGLSSTGARVALLTMPCTQDQESPDGSAYPESDPARIQRFNQLLVQAQARNPTKSTIVDLNAMVCPGGRFTSSLDGVAVRDADGIHFPPTDIAPVARWLMPQLRRLAVESRLSNPPSPTPAASPSASPPG